MRRLLVVAAVLLVASSGAMAQSGGQPSDTLPPLAPPPLAAPEAGATGNPSYPVYSASDAGLQVRGKVRAVNEAVLAAGISGILTELNTREGERVKQGAKLAQFDCAPLQAQYRVAVARNNAARTKLDVSKRLADLNNISKLDLALSNAEVAVSLAEQQQIRAEIDRCSIVAPYAAFVAEQFVHAHEFVREGDPVLRLVDTGDLEIEMVVPSQWMTRLHPGDAFSVHVDELDRTFPATIKYVLADVDPVSQTVRLVGIPGPDVEGLVPGMSGNVRFDFAAPVTVPGK